MSGYNFLGAARAIFTLEKESAVSNVSDAMKKIDETLVPHARSSLATSTQKSLFLTGIPTGKILMGSMGYLLPRESS